MKTTIQSKCSIFSLKLSLLFCALLTITKIHAQFEFPRIVGCYGISVLNENGEKISFKKGSAYSLRIDGNVYTVPQTPILKVQEDESENIINLEPPTQADQPRNYNPPEICLFSINDLTPPIYPESKNAQVEIIHGSDTMFFHSGRYSYSLKFKPGHYYFPFWINEMYELKPKCTKDIRFMNLDDQRHFLVSKADYNRISKSTDLTWLDDQIADNFAEGYFKVEKQVDSIRFNQTFDKYPIQQFHTIYPTTNKDLYLGFIRCNSSTNHAYNFVPCILNNKENTITYEPYKNDLTAYKFHWIFADTFNQIYYQTLSALDPSDNADIANNQTKNLWKPLVLKSTDEGKSWTKDTLLISLIEEKVRYHISLHDGTHSAGKAEIDHALAEQAAMQILFLDQSHSVISFSLRTYFKKTDMKQGIYYLVKNGQVIDSCKSPQLGFNDYVSDYSSILTKDTVMIGSWYIRSGNETRESDFTQLIVKEKNQWKFQNVHHNQSHDPKEVIKPEPKHQNFEITGEKNIRFKDGSSLTMSDEITSIPDWYRSLILENGNQIYILNKNSSTNWISFDQGKSWYFYPKLIDDLSSKCDIIETENGVISIFNASKLTKTKYRFVKE